MAASSHYLTSNSPGQAIIDSATKNMQIKMYGMLTDCFTTNTAELLKLFPKCITPKEWIVIAAF